MEMTEYRLYPYLSTQAYNTNIGETKNNNNKKKLRLTDNSVPNNVFVRQTLQMVSVPQLHLQYQHNPVHLWHPCIGYTLKILLRPLPLNQWAMNTWFLMYKVLKQIRVSITMMLDVCIWRYTQERVKPEWLTVWYFWLKPVLMHEELLEALKRWTTIGGSAVDEEVVENTYTKKTPNRSSMTVSLTMWLSFLFIFCLFGYCVLPCLSCLYGYNSLHVQWYQECTAIVNINEHNKMLMLGLQLQLNQLNVWANYGYVDTNDDSAKLFGEHLWLSNMSCWDIKIKIMVMSLLAIYQMCLHLFSGDCEYCVRPAVWHCHLPQAECPPATRNQTIQLINNRSRWKLKSERINRTGCRDMLGIYCALSSVLISVARHKFQNPITLWPRFEEMIKLCDRIVSWILFFIFHTQEYANINVSNVFLCHSSSIKTVNLRFLIIIMDHVIALKDHSSLNKRHQKLWKIFNNKK